MNPDPDKIGLFLQAGATTCVTLIPADKSARIPANQTASHLAAASGMLLAEAGLARADYVMVDVSQGGTTGQRAISAFAHGLAIAWQVAVISRAGDQPGAQSPEFSD